MLPKIGVGNYIGSRILRVDLIGDFGPELVRNRRKLSKNTFWTYYTHVQNRTSLYRHKLFSTTPPRPQNKVEENG